MKTPATDEPKTTEKVRELRLSGMPDGWLRLDFPGNVVTDHNTLADGKLMVRLEQTPEKA